MFGNKKLLKRIQDLEQFLGIIYFTDSDGYSYYRYGVSTYAPHKIEGVLEKLYPNLANKGKELKKK